MTNKYILTIAGSDILSGGGMQADLATFMQHGCFGFVALTSVVTVSEAGFEITPMDENLFAKQLRSLKTIPFAAIKLGLLPTSGLIDQVISFLKSQKPPTIVLDPVLVFKENQDEEVAQMRQKLIELMPHATLITPNLREAEILSGQPITNLDEMKAAAQRLYEFGAKEVVIKGGTRFSQTTALDLFYDGSQFEILEASLLACNNHGAGCTFASAIASQLALGQSSLAAVKEAKHYVHQAIATSNEYGVYHDKK